MCFSGGNTGPVGIPVCGNAQHCPDRAVTGTQIDQELSCRDVFYGECRSSMGNKHGWHHSSIQDNYPDDALDLKKIYISMKTGEEKSSVHLMYFYYREV
jgi:hypothetical protein